MGSVVRFYLVVYHLVEGRDLKHFAEMVQIRAHYVPAQFSLLRKTASLTTTFNNLILKNS